MASSPPVLFYGFTLFSCRSFCTSSIKETWPRRIHEGTFLETWCVLFFYMVFIHPIIVNGMLKQPEGPNRPSFTAYWMDYLSSRSVLEGSGPMWFAVALWFFCSVYALKHLLTGKKRSTATPPTKDVAKPAPTPGKLWLFGLGLVCGSFLVRLAYPLGSSIFNMQLGFFTQYVSVFILGIFADKNGWFEALVVSKYARKAGWLGLIIGPVFLVSLVAAGGPPPQDGTIIYSGGWNPWAFGLAFWEQLTGLAIGLGIMSWFYRFGSSSHSCASWLSRRSFGVYMLHSPIMVAFTPMCNSIADDSRLIAALILTVISLVASYITTDLMIRIPGIKKFI